MSHRYTLNTKEYGVITDTRAAGGYLYVPAYTEAGEPVRLGLFFDAAGIRKLADDLQRIAAAVEADPRTSDAAPRL